MKTRKTYQVILLVLLCILCNVAGRALTTRFRWPLWLDSFGTVCCSYVLGCVCGVMVGVTGNLIFSILFHARWIYLLTSVTLAILVGLFARRKSLDTFSGSLYVGILSSVAASVVSVPLNYLFYKGMTGNLWGDGVINLLQSLKWPFWLSMIIGEFYLDFFDKVLTLIIVYLAVRFYRHIRKKKAGLSKHGLLSEEELLNNTALAVASAVLVLSVLIPVTKTQAASARSLSLNYDDYVQTVYSNNNGLPCGTDNDIEETTDGILWIGTYAGLYRYNGREFEWMNNYDSIRNVNCLFTDDEGRLWVGTNDNGLVILINEKIVNIIDQSKGLPSDSVRCITESADGYYYIGTTGSMQILTLKNGLKKVSSLWEVNYSDSISADEEGHVAAVTSDGRLFLMKTGQILCSMQLPKNEEQINCCEFDRHGKLYVGTSLGNLYQYDISEGYFREISMTPCEDLASINNLQLLDNGEVFISSENGIAYLDRNGNLNLININDFNNSIDNMLQDYQGNLWFTSSRLGLLRLAPSPFRDIYTTLGLEHKVVNSVAKWHGDYYIGTDNGLDVIDGSLKFYVENKLTTQLKGIRIRCLFADSKGHLWICTYGQGLWEINKDRSIVLYNSENGSFGNRARLATELSDGTIVAAGDTGMCFIQDHEVLQTIGHADGLINSMILTVTEMSDGTVLAGTDGDGIALIKDRKVERMLTREDGLSSGVILRTVPDRNQDGVFLVTSNGLCYMDDAYSIRRLDNFPYYNNYDIWMKDSDTLLVPSSAGIFLVNYDELLSGKTELSYDLLDSRKGLRSSLTANSWNYYDADGTGNMFLSCDTGVFIANINDYTKGVQTYRMNVYSASLDGSPYHIESSTPFYVDRSVKKIELFPEVINYSVQDPNVGYYLEGYDDQWTIVPQSEFSTVSYMNLPSGSYTFHLAVYGSDESSVIAERTYQIIKLEDIYDKPWFIAYVIAGAMAFGFFLLFLWFRHSIERANLQIRMGNETIMAIANTVDAKDVRTSQHSARVAEYSVMIAQRMGFNKKERENLFKAARLHDIGKIAIPDRILNKPARLTDEEYAVMKSHTLRGEEILSGFTLVEHIKEGALYHHERYDGRGYPKGIKGEAIPLYGRIIGVADAFDAMTANRIYRNQMDLDYVLNELRKGRGTQFDPVVVDVFLNILEEGVIDLESLYPKQKEAADDQEKKADSPEAQRSQRKTPDSKTPGSKTEGRE